MATKEELEKLQLQINTIQNIANALAEGSATMKYEDQQFVVTKPVFDANTGDKTIESFKLNLDVVMNFVDMCDRQMEEAVKSFDSAKAAREKAGMMRESMKAIQQEAMPDSLE